MPIAAFAVGWPFLEWPLHYWSDRYSPARARPMRNDMPVTQTRRSNEQAGRSGRTPRREDGERSHSRILDAAERLLSERGYSGTGISAISRASGLPASSIYWFFDSKRDLAAAVVERAAERWLEGLERAGDVDFGTLVQRALEGAGNSLPDFIRLEVLLGLERGESDADLLERLRGTRDRARALVSAALSQSLRATGRPEGPPEVVRQVAGVAIAMANGVLISRHMDATSVDPKGLPDELEAAVLAVYDRKMAQQ